MSFSGTLGILMGKEFACKRRVHFFLSSLKRVVVVIVVIMLYISNSIITVYRHIPLLLYISISHNYRI